MEELIYRDRRGTNGLKWNGLKEHGFTRDDLLGMWVADMDFAAPGSVRKAVGDMAAFGVFGYDAVPEGYLPSFIRWMERRHSAKIDEQWVRFSPGVVSALNWIVQCFTKKDDAVIIETPVYYPFSRAVEENGRKLIAAELKEEGGRYSRDAGRFEELITQNDVKMFILCSPHNPVGRVWSHEELSEVLQICRRHDVLVIADEIHQDFELFGNKQVPALTITGEEPGIIAVTSASKTFNLAGLQNSFVIIPDAGLRENFDSYMKEITIRDGNSVGYAAVTAAYEGGEEWLDQILAKVEENYGILCEEMAKTASDVVVSPLEGTYLAWVFLGNYVPQEELVPFMEDECRIACDYGVWFGGESKGYIRMNLATSSENVREAARIIASKCAARK